MAKGKIIERKNKDGSTFYDVVVACDCLPSQFQVQIDGWQSAPGKGYFSLRNQPTET